MDLHLAQLNIATLRHPMDDPRTAGFAEGLPIVNAVADEAPGFVWRLQSDTGNATDIQVFDDPLVIVNLTVWTSVEALKAFAFRGTHREFFRRRAEWFVEGSTRTALWWTPVGDVPTTGDAKRRLDFIQAFGASPYAFQMGQVHRVLTMRRSATNAGCEVVADVDGEPAAFGSYRIVGSSAEIQRIDVPPPARGMRIGAAIVGELERAASDAGLQRLLLET
ncbi:MAG TPA: GNAT family N-acetyltransferase, partial [Ilumatobacteraceae bacterium]|nr:GNAT family N-acetyltransferase [Ilumatobacteraceae bacterium]